MGYTDILPFAFAWNEKINFLVFNTGKTISSAISIFGTFCFCFNVLVAGVMSLDVEEALQPAPRAAKEGPQR